MNAARLALANEPRFGFVQRVITRPAEAGGEDHIPMRREDFLVAAERGAFALHWQAHGLEYGIPAALHGEVTAGRVMIVNLSRREIPLAEQVFDRLVVIEITAPVAVLAARLAARGRESETDIAARLAREAPLVVARARHRVIENAGSVADAAARLIAEIRAQAR